MAAVDFSATWSSLEGQLEHMLATNNSLFEISSFQITRPKPLRSIGIGDGTAGEIEELWLTGQRMPMWPRKDQTPGSDRKRYAFRRAGP